jgi:hypothetical protein
MTVDEILIRLTSVMRWAAVGFTVASVVGFGSAVMALRDGVLSNHWLVLVFLSWVGAIACSGIGWVTAMKTEFLLRCISPE